MLNLPKGCAHFQLNLYHETLYLCSARTMIHLDADAQMAQFEDSETGKKRSALNLIHSKAFLYCAEGFVPDFKDVY